VRTNFIAGIVARRSFAIKDSVVSCRRRFKTGFLAGSKLDSKFRG